jgi:GNAT superfamily N-acetyltransferase
MRVEMTSQGTTVARTTTDALARAFFDEPGSVWFMPDDARRTRFLEEFFSMAMGYAARHGAVDEEPGIGAALWLPPRQPFLNPLGALRFGFWRLPFLMGLRAIQRSVPANRLMDRHHKELVQRRHWYLMVLGVDPEVQGTGRGGSLMLPGLRRADQDGLPCYLETGKEVNVRFYGRRGFEVVAEGDLPGGGPPYWCMRRPPAAVSP